VYVELNNKIFRMFYDKDRNFLLGVLDFDMIDCQVKV
jgi:hypothetical protein